jgi:hypothetical protein
LVGGGLAGLQLTEGIGPLDGTSEYLAAEAGLGRSYFGVQAFDNGENDTVRDAQGQVGATFTNQESLIGLNYALVLGPLSLGVGAKALYESLAGHVAGLGAMVDTGLLLRVFDQRLLLSLAIENVGVAPQWTYGASISPMTLAMGLREAVFDNRRLRLFEDLREVFPFDPSGETPATQGDSMLLGWGVEYVLPQGLFPLCLRAGYCASNDGLAAPQGLSVGFGLTWKRVSFDYAFVSLGELGASNRLGLSWELPHQASPMPEPRSVAPAPAEASPASAGAATAEDLSETAGAGGAWPTPPPPSTSGRSPESAEGVTATAEPLSPAAGVEGDWPTPPPAPAAGINQESASEVTATAQSLSPSAADTAGGGDRAQ